MKESNGRRRKGGRRARKLKKINKDLFFSVNGCNQSRECDTRGGGETEGVISSEMSERD